MLKQEKAQPLETGLKKYPHHPPRWQVRQVVRASGPFRLLWAANPIALRYRHDQIHCWKIARGDSCERRAGVARLWAGLRTGRRRAFRSLPFGCPRGAGGCVR
jgi:hypothetical protein